MALSVPSCSAGQPLVTMTVLCVGTSFSACICLCVQGLVCWIEPGQVEPRRIPAEATLQNSYKCRTGAY